MPRTPSPLRHLLSNDPWKKNWMLLKIQVPLHATDYPPQGLHQPESVRCCSIRKYEVIGAPNRCDLFRQVEEDVEVSGSMVAMSFCASQSLQSERPAVGSLLIPAPHSTSGRGRR